MNEEDILQTLEELEEMGLVISHTGADGQTYYSLTPAGSEMAEEMGGPIHPMYNSSNLN